MRVLSLLAGLFALVAVTVGGPARAQDAVVTEQQMLINRSVATIERLLTDDNFRQSLQPLFERARAVLIVPNMLKAGFILGGEWGTGVLLVRGPQGWSHPAFYTVGAGSVGLQVGVQDSEVLFLVMTDAGLEAIMNNNVKMGAEIGVSFLIAGAGMEAATTSNLGADVYAYARSFGLFGGGAFEGAVIRSRNTWNAAFYGPQATAEAIVLRREYANPGAEKLREILAR